MSEDGEKKKEDWMNNKWRPMMGWMYMAVCSFDFVVAPVMWSLLQSLSQGSVQTQWQPLTLQGAGLFHIAMGAVLGLSAYGRTQEKLAGANNGGLSTTGTSYTPPVSQISTSPFPSAPIVSSTGTSYTPPASQLSTTTSPFPSAPIVSSAGKLAPPPQQDSPL
jgi:hypothetical protein